MEIHEIVEKLKEIATEASQNMNIPDYAVSDLRDTIELIGRCDISKLPKINDDEKALMLSNHPISGIREYRIRTHVSLFQAKQVYEELKRDPQT